MKTIQGVFFEVFSVRKCGENAKLCYMDTDSYMDNWFLSTYIY